MARTKATSAATEAANATIATLDHKESQVLASSPTILAAESDPVEASADGAATGNLGGDTGAAAVTTENPVTEASSNGLQPDPVAEQDSAISEDPAAPIATTANALQSQAAPEDKTSAADAQPEDTIDVDLAAGADDVSGQAGIYAGVVAAPAPAEPAPAREEVSTVDDPNPVEVDIFPLRTYHDAGDLKRRGGPSYRAPRLHAQQLIVAGLATDKKPKA